LRGFFIAHNGDTWQHGQPMSYSLSFADDFFYPEQLQQTSRPTNVYQAVKGMSGDTWRQMASDVFHVEPDQLDVEAVIEQIRQTDTCLALYSPVEVLIDGEGDYSVSVYDQQPDE